MPPCPGSDANRVAYWNLQCNVPVSTKVVVASHIEDLFMAGYLPMPPESMFSLTCLLAVLDAFGLDAKGGLLLFAIVCRVCEHDQNYDHLSHHRNISKWTAGRSSNEAARNHRTYSSPGYPLPHDWRQLRPVRVFRGQVPEDFSHFCAADHMLLFNELSGSPILESAFAGRSLIHRLWLTDTLEFQPEACSSFLQWLVTPQALTASGMGHCVYMSLSSQRSLRTFTEFVHDLRSARWVEASQPERWNMQSRSQNIFLFT